MGTSVLSLQVEVAAFLPHKGYVGNPSPLEYVMPQKQEIVTFPDGKQGYQYERGGVYVRHNALEVAEGVEYPTVENILIGREQGHPADAECDPTQRLVRNDHGYGDCTIRVWTRDGEMIYTEINFI